MAMQRRVTLADYPGPGLPSNRGHCNLAQGRVYQTLPRESRREDFQSIEPGNRLLDLRNVKVDLVNVCQAISWISDLSDKLLVT